MHTFISSGMDKTIQEQPYWIMTMVPDPVCDNELNKREETTDYFM